MRSLLKLSLASLAAVALFAGIASAQDDAAKMTVNAIFRDAFEFSASKSEARKATYQGGNPADKASTAETGINNDWQSDLYFTWESNSVRARWQLRFRDDAATSKNNAAASAPNSGTAAAPQSSRTDLYWKASSNFWLGFMMRAEGLEPGTTVGYSVYGGTVTGGAGMTYLGTRGAAQLGMFGNGLASQSAGPGGGVGPVGFFSDVNGIDARFVISPTMTAGVAILDSCVPQCGYSVTDPVIAGNSSASFVGDKADQTIVPYFQGAFGPLTLGVFLTQATAKQASLKTAAAFTSDATATNSKDSDKNAASSAVTDVNGKLVFGTFQIGFEVWNASSSCITKVSKGCSAATESAVVLGVKTPAGPGTLTAHIESISDAATLIKNLDATQTISDLMVEYSIPFGPNFNLVPLYTTRSQAFENKVKNGTKTNDDRNVSFAALGARANF